MPAVRQVAQKFGLLGGWSGTPDFLDAERSFGALLLAPDGAGGALGFGGTLRRGAVTHLGDLFVLPEHQSSGVGRALLTELLPGDGPKVTFASSDPRAVALYVRHGLRPWTPLLYLTGPATGLPTPSARPTQAEDVAARPTWAKDVEARPVRAEDVAALDAHASGGARSDTLAWYAGLPGVTMYATDGGYAAARLTGPDVVIGPAGGETSQDCADAVLGALAGTRARSARMAVPGTHPLVPALLGAGWRIADMDTLMADDAVLALIRPDRYVPHPDLG
ncbi:GNAT family N-acetyltransferase [Nonomuraea sp. B12E4]|uniref:GNAT family N-acetyltransferase n=1 Tax=Nonomuraea sp. B12E4 TaxID=3153564 RepID=UPI00325D908A